ncbi:MAG: T9SS type A sorting domain-containing protein [Bacteroidia bacterium]
MSDDPNDTSIWVAGRARSRINGEWLHYNILFHFDKYGNLLGDNENVTLTSIAPRRSPKQFNNLNLFPNPASNSINIDLRSFNTNSIQLQIISTDARVKTLNLTNSLHEIDISAYPKGIYFIQTQLDNENYQAKFVVE